METRVESGNITIAFAILMTILLMLFVGVADLGGAWATRSAMENDLAAAMDQRKTTAEGLVTKNVSGDWFVAEGIVESLRRDGFDGKVTIWVAEAKAGSVPADRRAIGVWAWTSTTYEPMTLGRLMGEIDLAAQDGCHLVPYSAGTAWRQNGQERVTKLVAEAGSSTLVETGASMDTAPQQVRAELAKAVNEASDE